MSLGMVGTAEAGSAGVGIDSAARAVAGGGLGAAGGIAPGSTGGMGLVVS